MTTWTRSVRRRWDQRLGGVRMWMVGVAIAVVAVVAATPPVLLDMGADRARSCLARVAAPRGPELPSCEDLAGWFTLPALAPWTARYAEQAREELLARMAAARYVDAAVGVPDRGALEQQVGGVLAAERQVAEGSGRLRLDRLGPAIPAPELGALAHSVGDGRALEDHAFDWTQWYTAVHAIDAALLRADLVWAIRLAEHYAGRPNSDLGLTVGALLCIGGEAERGMELIEPVESGRAGKRNANMWRNFGTSRVLLEACAAFDDRAPPPVPGLGTAGKWDHRDRLAVLRLRVAERVTGCDPTAAVKACSQVDRLADAAAGVAERLALARSSRRYRLELIAALAPYLHDTAQASDLGAMTLQTDAMAAIPLTLQQFVDRSAPDQPFVTAQRYALAAARVHRLDPASPILAALAGALRLRAAVEYAARGERAAAWAQVDMGGPWVCADPLALALFRSSVAYLTGEGAGGAAAPLNAALQASREPDALGAAAHLQYADLLASAGRHAEALAAARRGLDVARRAEASEPLERARWMELALTALAAESGGLPLVPGKTTSPLPHLGPLDPTLPESTRQLDLTEVLAAWRTGLNGSSADRRAFRYVLYQGRDHAQWAPVSRLAAAGQLVDAPAQVEPWLDALSALDVGRMTHRSYAFARAQAARWRGDPTLATHWFERHRSLERWATQPWTAELFQQLRL